MRTPAFVVAGLRLLTTTTIAFAHAAPFAGLALTLAFLSVAACTDEEMASVGRPPGDTNPPSASPAPTEPVPPSDPPSADGDPPTANPHPSEPDPPMDAPTPDPNTPPVGHPPGGSKPDAKPPPPIDPGPRGLDFQQFIFDDALVAYQRAIGDIDGDGVNDIVATPLESVGDLRLYRGPDFQTEVVLALAADVHGFPLFRADGLKLADLDGDGDLDVVARIGDSGTNGRVVWIENPHTTPGDISGAWIVHDIGANGYTKDIVVADFDGDGRIDIATRTEGGKSQVWFNDCPAGWSARTLTHPGWEGMAAGDLDGDGDADLVYNGFWLETPVDPRQQPFAEHTIDPKWYNQNVGWQSDSCKVVIADIDGDGANDVVLSHSEYTGYPVSWYSADDPRNGPWVERIIVPVCDYCHNLQVADFDDDGQLDVLYGGMVNSPQAGLTVMLGDGGATWSSHSIQSEGSYSAALGDIDNDGDWDIVTIRNWDRAPSEVWRNVPGKPAGTLGLDQWTRVLVDGARDRWSPALAFFGLGWGDIDGDGYLDIVSGGFFYRNPGGDMSQSPWPRVAFNVGVNLDASLVVDVDGDAFADVIASAGPQVYWLEADVVTGDSWTAHLIDDNAPSDPVHKIPQGYAIANVTAGGRPEILLNNGGMVYAYEIPNGNPEAGNWPRTILVEQSNSEDIGVGDIDGDGRVDIAVGYWGESGAKNVKWALNPGDGSGNWGEFVVGEVAPAGVPVFADRVKVADLNGDGRPDIVCTQETALEPASIFWFEAPADPRQPSWTRHTIATQFTTNSLDVADIDDDGDIDVITQEHRGTKKLQIWENNGFGNFTERLIDTGIEGHLGARVADLDQDGDLEIFSIAFDASSDLYLWRNDNR